ncbi:MAG TPA: CbiX/SirB N-terminal domain-containing protein [Geminicoccaceae bacterium]|nr:CbiX/SirB N-terminal domain-containing protein [Geminicoccus sp.]HMU50646.1 CbiX/SirB N-terminal domain-containing protein [Geminicoccaceae bacterium]
MAVEHARRIRGRSRWTQVRVGCLKASPSLAEAMADAPDPVTVVPLLMSDGVIHQALRHRLREIAPDRRWHLTSPVGDSPGLGRLVRARAGAWCHRLGWPHGDTSLLLIGHGTPRHVASASHAAAVAETLQGCGFAAVGYALLEESPLPAEAIAVMPGGHVVAVGLFLDNGPHGDKDVREALAGVARDVAYAGAIGADRALVRLILAQAMAT